MDHHHTPTGPEKEEGATVLRIQTPFLWPKLGGMGQQMQAAYFTLALPALIR